MLKLAKVDIDPYFTLKATEIEVETVFGVFLDIQSAYDTVNLPKLYNYLLQYNIPTQMANLIFRLMHSRHIYVKDNKGNIHGPELCTVGIAQGSPLSSLLFNIYTRSIFDVIPDNLLLIAYADDLILLA